MNREKRRHVRVAGPFEASRVGLMETEVQVYDLSDGGCFVATTQTPPSPGQQFVLKIHLPSEGWIYVKGQAVYSKAHTGYAVSFLDMPVEASDRLQRELLRLRGLLPEAERDRAMMLPICPRCRSTAVRAVGMAASTLPWFTCGECAYVWPARAEAVSTETSAATDPVSSGGRKQILIVDDDSGVLNLLARALSSYHVVTARDVSEASTVGSTLPLDLLITDYLMPDGTGDELIAKLRERRPSLKVLLISGHHGMLDEAESGVWKNERHLSKPFTVDDLRMAVADLIGSSQSGG